MVEWLHDNPWRQGHVLTDDSVKALGIVHPSSPDDTVVIVVSHDCDLAQDVCTEPTCEIILGRKIHAQEGNFSNAKSVRRLHITCSDGATNSIIELEISNRRSISKTDLTGHLPAESIKLTVHEKSLLQTWLGARYSRHSFPTEFERRLTVGAKKSYEKIVRRLKQSSGDILIVLFDLDQTAEIDLNGPDDVYTLTIYLVFNVDGGDPLKAKTEALNVAAEIKKLLQSEFLANGKWSNIELVDCIAVSEESVTLRMARLTKRWHLDYISLREKQPTC